MSITPTGIGSSAASGSPAIARIIALAGYGIASVAQCGTPAIGDATAPFLTFYLGGVNRNALVKVDANEGEGVKRSVTLTGGSKATCSFFLYNRKGFHRPAKGEEVVILRADGTRFFAGVVDSISEYDFTGSAGLNRMQVNCADYGALCDRRVVGREYQHRDVSRLSQLFYQVASRYLADLGIEYVFVSEAGQLSGDLIYNWISATDVFNQACSSANADWRVDFYKALYVFNPDAGYADAPFTLADNDGNWAEMTVDRDYSKYYNRVGVRSSQNVNPLWTDSFTVASSADAIWVTMAPLSDKPIVKVNGTAKTVISSDQVGALPYDFAWTGYGIFRNQSFAVSGGDVITVTYPSPLSYVAWAQDDTEIATYGLFEKVFEAKDITDLDTLQALADALLVRTKVMPTTIKFKCTRKGQAIGSDALEPGMLLRGVNLTRPAVSGDFLITDNQSAAVGKQYFESQLTASDAASRSIANLDAFFAAVIAQGIQPRDRVREHLIFQLAETIEGITNPGLSTGVKQAIRTIPADCILSRCTLQFNTPPASTDCIIDVRIDGASIFPSGSGNKMVYPAGTTDIIVNLQFDAAPYLATKGDPVTIEVIQADATAMDGTLDLEVLVK